MLRLVERSVAKVYLCVWVILAMLPVFIPQHSEVKVATLITPSLLNYETYFVAIPR